MDQRRIAYIAYEIVLCHHNFMLVWNMKQLCVASYAPRLKLDKKAEIWGGIQRRAIKLIND